MASNLFVYVSHKDGKVDDSALELITAARAVAPEQPPIAIVTGEGASLEAVCGEAAASFGEVWKFDHAMLGYPNAEVLRPLLAKVLPEGAQVLLPHSTLGMDLGPGLSVKTGAAYVADVIGVDGSDGTTLMAVRQEFNGQVCTHVHCDTSRGVVLTVRSGAFRPEESRAAHGTVVDRSAETAGIASRRRFVEVIEAESGDIDITREDILVSVGRGIGEQDNLGVVEELAQAMGAALCCSRPIVDAKWLEKPRQVGTSGQTVKPKVYLALGISGSFQHMGGIKGNPCIIAVNKNPKAPIFQAASVGVVADLMDLVPALTEQIIKSR